MTNLKHRTWPCVLLWSLTGLWFALIWYFSAQSGAESELLSGGLARRAAAWLLPHADAQSLAALEHLLRKAAHMSEFAVLACLLALSMQASRVPHPVHFACTLSILAAIVDECHQLFVSGRSGEVGDVVIDVVGAAAGLFVFALIRRIVRRRRRLQTGGAS